MLKESAITHDSKLRVQPARAARRVYEHEAAYYDEPPDPGEDFDIDSSIDTILANKTLTKFTSSNPNSLMPKEAYLKLAPAARSTWNKLDATSKALILSAHKYKVDKPPKPPYNKNASSNRFTLAELHQLIDAHCDSNNSGIISEDTEEDST